MDPNTDGPSGEELKRMLRYDPETGKLYWLARTPDLFESKGGHSIEHTCAKWNSLFAGKEAFTCRTTNGYRCGRINTSAYLAHRVIWALHNDEWPTVGIDHVDRDKNNNRIENLRLATKSQNAANTEKQAGCSSTYRGVCWQKSARKWTAGISINGRRRHLGLFDREEDAARAYDKAAKAKSGEFANLNL